MVFASIDPVSGRFASAEPIMAAADCDPDADKRSPGCRQGTPHSHCNFCLLVCSLREQSSRKAGRPVAAHLRLGQILRIHGLDQR